MSRTRRLSATAVPPRKARTRRSTGSTRRGESLRPRSITSMAWSSSDWRMSEVSSSPGAGGAERPVVGGPAGCPSLGPEVAGVLVLEVGEGGGVSGGDVAQRGDEAVDVGGTGGQAGAGPHRPGHVPPVVLEHGLAVAGHLLGTEVGQAEQGGGGAEAAGAGGRSRLRRQAGGPPRAGGAPH